MASKSGTPGIGISISSAESLGFQRERLINKLPSCLTTAVSVTSGGNWCMCTAQCHGFANEISLNPVHA